MTALMLAREAEAAQQTVKRGGIQGNDAISDTGVTCPVAPDPTCPS
jgi:hypothetical protein